MIEQKTLDQLGICEHRYYNCAIVTLHSGPAAVLWCVKCADVQVTLLEDSDNPEEEESIEDHAALN